MNEILYNIMMEKGKREKDVKLYKMTYKKERKKERRKSKGCDKNYYVKKRKKKKGKVQTNN